MKTVICDRCKKVVGETNQTIERYIEFSLVDPTNSISSFFGVKKDFELCKECFDEFWDFVNNNNEKR